MSEKRNLRLLARTAMAGSLILLFLLLVRLHGVYFTSGGWWRWGLHAMGAVVVVLLLWRRERRHLLALVAGVALSDLAYLVTQERIVGSLRMSHPEIEMCVYEPEWGGRCISPLSLVPAERIGSAVVFPTSAVERYVRLSISTLLCLGLLVPLATRGGCTQAAAENQDSESDSV